MGTKQEELYFSNKVKSAVNRIPFGKVATFEQIAALTGKANAYCGVASVLYAFSERKELPWYRVVNRMGGISFKQGEGYEKQRKLLEKEGVRFNQFDRIDLLQYLWDPK